jgi:hypothetical protein
MASCCANFPVMPVGVSYVCSCACRDINMNIVDATGLFVLQWLSWITYPNRTLGWVLTCNICWVVRRAY